jgi:hypothetical protein
MKTFEELEKERRVGSTDLANDFWVSAVRLSCEHWGGKWYETTVFKRPDFTDLDLARYVTLEEAKIGHEVMVEKWRPKAERDERS